MDIYEKILTARRLFLDANVKKTGRNKFQNFDYFELEDIVPTVLDICEELKLLPLTAFTDVMAVLKIVNVENAEETVTFTNPVPKIVDNNANKVIQDIGKVQTYQRRYLYMQFLDIIENDNVDASDAAAKKSKGKGKTAPKSAPKATPKPAKASPKTPKAPKAPATKKSKTPAPPKAPKASDENEEEVPKEGLEKACKEYPLLRKVIPSLKADKVVLNEENFKNELIDDGRFPPSDIEKIMKIVTGA